MPQIILSSTTGIIDASTNTGISDVEVEQLMLKSAIDGNMLFTVAITFASSIAVNMFSQWLYDKMKNKPDEKVVINGNHISAKTVQVLQIIQIIEQPPVNK